MSIEVLKFQYCRKENFMKAVVLEYVTPEVLKKKENESESEN